MPDHSKQLAECRGQFHVLEVRAAEDRETRRARDKEMLAEFRALRESMVADFKDFRIALFGNGSGGGIIPKIDKRVDSLESDIKHVRDIIDRRTTSETRRRKSIWAKLPVSRDGTRDIVLLVLALGVAGPDVLSILGRIMSFLEGLL